MYQGRNPIAKRSQNWLAEAFLQLLKIKPYAQINIKDICIRANLSRQTFYQLFSGKEEVARYAVHYRKCLALYPCSENLKTSEGLKQMVQQFSRAVRNNKELITLYRRNSLQYLLNEEISKTLAAAQIKFGRESDAHIQPLVSAFFTGALARSLMVLSDNAEISDEEFADFFCSVIKGE